MPPRARQLHATLTIITDGDTTAGGRARQLHATCSAGIPTLGGSCTAAACDVGHFKTDSDVSDGCETVCRSFADGSGTACFDACAGTGVTCDADRFNTDGDASNGCEVGCPSVADGSYTADADASTCIKIIAMPTPL